MSRGVQVTSAVHFGANLKARRTAAGLSQSQLAELAGCHYRTVGYAETGKQYPRLDNALLLATALGTTIDGLLASPPNGDQVFAAAPMEETAEFLHQLELRHGVKTWLETRVNGNGDFTARVRLKPV